MRRLTCGLFIAVLASGCLFRSSTDVTPLTGAVAQLAREGFHARESAVYKRGEPAQERLIDFSPPDSLRVDGRSLGSVVIVGRRVYSSSATGYVCTPAPSGFNASNIAGQLTAAIDAAKKAKKFDTGFTFVYEIGSRKGTGRATLRDGNLVRLVTTLQKGQPSDQWPVSADVRFSRIGEPPAVTAPPTAKPTAKFSSPQIRTPAPC